MNHRFSPEELGRLLGIATEVMDTHGCSPAQAIGLIARASGRADLAGNASIGRYAEGLRRVRARRNALLGANIVRDPAWDMMLDLLAAHHDGRETCVKTLCVGADVAPTTALRHIDVLEEHGIVERLPHPRDQRRTLVRLRAEPLRRLEEVVGMIRDLA